MKRKRFLLVLLWILTLLFVLSSCGGTIVIIIGDYGILFVTERDGNKEIYLVRPKTFGGMEVVNLTNNPDDDLAPAWRNDGVIGFLRLSASGLSLWMMNKDGTNPVKLVDVGNVDPRAYLPSWSPDGNKIVVGYKDNTMFPSSHLAVYDLSTGILTIIEDAGFMVALGSGVMNPSSSYHEIAYHEGMIFQDIYTSSYDGSVKTNLTNTSGSSNLNPCWNSDGTKIAYSCQKTGGYEICVMNRDGSSNTQITNDTKDDRTPHWVGNKIVYEKDGDIYLSYFDGTNWNEKAVYVDGATSEKYPRLSPDGNRVAFLSDMSGDWRIYVIKIDAQGNPQGSPVEVSNGAVVDDYPPLWSTVLF